jgi:hypothetical protein
VVLGPLDSRLYNEGSSAAQSLEKENASTADTEKRCIVALHKLRADKILRSEAVKLVTEMEALPRSYVYKLALEIEW